MSFQKGKTWMVALLAAAMLVCGVLSVQADPNTTTRIVFVRSAVDADMTPYRTYLSDFVYAGQTMVFDDVRYDFEDAVLNQAKTDRLNNADLVIFAQPRNYWSNNYNNAIWRTALQAPLIVNQPSQAGFWGWLNVASIGSDGNTATNGIQANHGPAVGQLVKPAATSATDPFFALNNLGANLGLTPDAVDPANYQWMDIYTGAQYQTGLGLSYAADLPNAGQGIKLLAATKGRWWGTTPAGAEIDTDLGGEFTPNVIRWDQYMTGQNGAQMPARRFFFAFSGRNQGDNNGLGSLPNVFNAQLSDTGKAALKNALLLMYDPQFGRRPVVTMPATAIGVSRLVGVPSIDVPVPGATITNGGTLPDAAIDWVVTPAIGFDAAGSTGLDTATPTLRFTDDGTYTVTVRAKKPGLDYITASRQIVVASGEPVVAATTPADASSPTYPLTTISVRFNTGVTGVGALTINGTVDAGLPTTADNITFTWALPVSLRPFKSGPLSFSLDTSTVAAQTEPANLFAAATYTWGADFVMLPLPVKINFSRQGTNDPGYLQYVTFLRTEAYPGYAVTVNPDFDFMNNWGAALSVAQKNEIAAADLIVTAPLIDNSSRLGTVSNACGQDFADVTKPIMVHHGQIAYRWGMTTGYYGAPLAVTLYEGKIAAYEWNGTDGPLPGGAANPPYVDPLWDGFTIEPFANPSSPRLPYESDGLQIFPADKAFILGTNLMTPGSINYLRNNRTWDQTAQIGTGKALAWAFTPLANAPGTGNAQQDGCLMARWDANGTGGQNDSRTGARIVYKGKRMFMAIGDSNNWFAADAFTPTRKALLKSALWSLYTPPSPGSIVAVAPPNNAEFGLLPKIRITFSKPVTGVQSGDLTFNPSTAGFPPLVSTSATPIGGTGGASLVWEFDGPWTSSTYGLVGQFGQTIYMQLNCGDPAGVFSHIVDPINGLPVTNVPYSWQWDYVWLPGPASVDQKNWTLYR